METVGGLVWTDTAAAVGPLGALLLAALFGSCALSWYIAFLLWRRVLVLQDQLVKTLEQNTTTMTVLTHAFRGKDAT